MQGVLRFLLASCLLVPLGDASASGARASLLSQAYRAQAILGMQLPAQPSGEAASRTLAALDTDHDGRVSPSEVTAFAMAQGLDAQSASREFAALDRNGDGTLGASEVAAALGAVDDQAAQAVPSVSESAPRATETAPPPTSQPLLAAARPAAVAPTRPLLASRPGASLSVVRQAATTGADAKKTAASVVEQLTLEANEEGEAQALERHSAELRANATNLARLTLQRAAAAGAAAARSRADELLEKLSRLERQAEKDEVGAAALRAKTRAEALQAEELMGVASVALQP